MAVVGAGGGPGYAYMQFPGHLAYSYYFRPGGPVEKFEAFLTSLDADVKGQQIADAALVVAGGFNAKSLSWSSRTVDARGVPLK